MKQRQKHIVHWIWMFSILGLPLSLCGQDVEEKISTISQRWKEDPLKVSGVLGLYGNSYSTNNEFNRAAPFAGRAMAALNLDLLGIKAPFTMAVSTGGKAFNYSLPAYSFVGISPSYKWATLHLGDRSMDLGKYTFSRQSFKGIGTELNPGKWRFSAFYGRIRRARENDFGGLQRIEPFFKRVGWGVQGGYEQGQDKVLVSVFQAWDVANSTAIPDSSFQFFAGQNAIVSTLISKQIRSNLHVKIEYANSGYTEDKASPNGLQLGFGKRFGGLLETNTSSRWGNAFSTALKLKTGFGSLSGEWERIDPGYKTMGSLFFQNDIQNWSLGASARLLKKRIGINARLGVQQNNISGNQANAYNRLIGFLRLGYQMTPRISFDVGYSTFNNVNRRVVILDPINPIPTSELVLSNEDAQLSVNWILSQSAEKVSSIQSTMNLNSGQSILNDEVQADGETRSLNWMTYFSQQFIPQKWNIGLSLSHQQNEFGSSRISTQSIGLTTGKQMLDDQLSIQFHSTIGISDQSFLDQGNIKATLITLNLNGGWKLSEKSSLNLNSMLIVNNTDVDEADFNEWRNTLAYQYRF